MTHQEPNADEQLKESLYDYIDKHYWSVFLADTATISNSCRQLALAEGGICWVLILRSGDMSTVVTFLACITFIFLILFYYFDIKQYQASSKEYESLARDYNDKVTSGDIKTVGGLAPSEGMADNSNWYFKKKILMLKWASGATIATLLLMLLISWFGV